MNNAILCFRPKGRCLPGHRTCHHTWQGSSLSGLSTSQLHRWTEKSVTGKYKLMLWDSKCENLSEIILVPCFTGEPAHVWCACRIAQCRLAERSHVPPVYPGCSICTSICNVVEQRREEKTVGLDGPLGSLWPWPSVFLPLRCPTVCHPGLSATTSLQVLEKKFFDWICQMRFRSTEG